MKVETLEAYNVPSDILAIWRSQVGADLLPVQERAVKEFGLFSQGNLIVFSPTSSGKTFIGEMAAVKAARGNTKVFYLVPQKALAGSPTAAIPSRQDRPITCGAARYLRSLFWRLARAKWSRWLISRWGCAS